jgi:hypothetical protein
MSRIIEADQADFVAVPPLTHVPRTTPGVISFAARDIGNGSTRMRWSRSHHRDTVRPLARLHHPAATGLHPVRPSTTNSRCPGSHHLRHPERGQHQRNEQVSRPRHPGLQIGDTAVIVARSSSCRSAPHQSHPRQLTRPPGLTGTSPDCTTTATGARRPNLSRRRIGN